MTRSHRRFFGAVALAAAVVACIIVAGASTHAATVNKCYDLDGRITYRDSPCDQTSLPDTIDVPGRASGRSSAAAGAPVREPAQQAPAGGPAADSATRPWVLPPGSRYSRRQIEEAGDIAAAIDGCEKKLPAFGMENASRIKAWKSQNAGVIRAAEEHEVTRERMRRLRDDPTELKPEGARLGLPPLCELISATYLGNTRAAGSDSPGAVWERMIRALGAGKIDEAMESVRPDRRERYRKLFGSEDDTLLKKRAGALGTLHRVQLIGGDAATANEAVGALRLPDNTELQARFSRVLGRWYVADF